MRLKDLQIIRVFYPHDLFNNPFCRWLRFTDELTPTCQPHLLSHLAFFAAALCAAKLPPTAVSRTGTKQATWL